MKVSSGNIAALLFVWCWPFIVLAPYTLGLLTPGNDFHVLYYNYKAYFVRLVADGLYPLWAPGEGTGFPLYANPFAQYAYPLNALVLAYYFGAGDFTPWAYTMFTLLGFSFFGAGLYLWLRELSLQIPVALTATLVAVMSLKVTELLRFPNAAHSAAWIPWLLYAVTLASERQHFARGIGIFGLSCLLLFTAGYPYFIVYAPFIVLPYSCAVITRPLRPAFVPGSVSRTHPVVFLLALLAAATVAAITAAPWLLAVQDLMAQTVDRGTPNFDYATAHRFGWIGTLGSWIYPPVSMHEGWYYFGMITTLLIAALVISLITGSNTDRRDRTLAPILIAWILAISYFVLGRDSALFTFVWHHVPLLDQLRVWPRMNIVLVPAVCLLLALSLDFLTRLPRNAPVASRALIPMACLVLVILAAQLRLISQQHEPQFWNTYWNQYFKMHPWPDLTAGAWSRMRAFDERHFPEMTVVAAIVVLGNFWFRRRFAKVTAILCTAVVAITLWDVGFVSVVQWSQPFVHQSPTVSAQTISRYIELPRVPAAGTVDPIGTTLYAGAFSNWGYRRHMDFYGRYFDSSGEPNRALAPDEREAARRFFGIGTNPRRLFVSSTIEYLTPAAFMADSDQTEADSLRALNVIEYDGNSLVVEIDVNQAGWLTFVDNWDPHWLARLNGQPAPINKLFGSYKSVKVPAGMSRIEFEYAPPLWRDIARLLSQLR